MWSVLIIFKTVDETELSVWSTLALSHRCSLRDTNAQVPLCTGRDLLFDTDDDEFLSEDAMVVTRDESHGHCPSAGRFGYKESEPVDLDGDDSLNSDVSDYYLLDGGDTEVAFKPCLEPPYGSELSHLSSRDITASELGSGDLYGGVSGILSDGE